MINQGYEGVYQLANFHPDYFISEVRATTLQPITPIDSPNPMLHIIRETGIKRALQSYPNLENIPKHNIAPTHKPGLKHLTARLATCKEDQGN